MRGLKLKNTQVDKLRGKGAITKTHTTIKIAHSTNYWAGEVSPSYHETYGPDSIVFPIINWF